MALVGAQFVNAVSPNPVGSLQAYAGASAPSGWLLCDGTSYSTSVYPELFSVLGYTYGGSAGNFNVPDLRGRTPIGAGNDGTAANNATRTRGDKGGDTRMPQHNHQLGGILTQTVPSSSPTVYVASYGNGSPETRFTSNNGSGTGENMPPFLVTNYIIKAVPDAPRSGLAYGSTPPIVTALPSNPQFGDVVTYIADATNGVAWNLQYDATGTYPWKFIGGSAYRSVVALGNGDETTTSTSYTNLATVGPDYQIVLPGDYEFSFDIEAFRNDGGAGTDAYISYQAGSTNNAADNTRISNGSGQLSPGAMHRAVTGLAAGDYIQMKYRVSSSTGRFRGTRRLFVTPVRVKAA